MPQGVRLSNVMLTIATGAMWTRQRVFQETKTPDVDAKCPRCGLANEDDFHRAWECEGNQDNPSIQGTNYLLPEAYAQRD
eukprot:9489994-Pyramimonas_sp.AAC.1